MLNLPVYKDCDICFDSESVIMSHFPRGKQPKYEQGATVGHPN